MVQIFPAIIFGLYTRWFSGWALLIGWAAGMIVGTALSWGEKAWTPVHALAWDVPFVGHVDLGLHFAAYNGLTAVIVNIVVATVLSLVIRSQAADETTPPITRTAPSRRERRRRRRVARLRRGTPPLPARGESRRSRCALSPAPNLLPQRETRCATTCCAARGS